MGTVEYRQRTSFAQQDRYEKPLLVMMYVSFSDMISGVPFPKSFPALVRQIFKRMYRVYAHIYCHHYPVIRELGLEPHLNTSFKQYVLFIDEHSLASGRDYWGPLGDLVDSMLKSD